MYIKLLYIEECIWEYISDGMHMCVTSHKRQLTLLFIINSKKNNHKVIHAMPLDNRA